MDSAPTSVSGSGPSAAADYPRWVMLDRGERWQQGTSTGDASTSASCYGSAGNTVQVSFRLAAPPAMSTLHVDARLPCGWTNAHRYGPIECCHVLISAHRDSVLISLCCNHPPVAPYDYFVYTAGGKGGARLLLLPPCSKDMYSDNYVTGVLRCGGDEFVVASLVLVSTCGRPGDLVEASMCVLRSGECKWEHWNRIPVCHADGHEAKLSEWCTGYVVAVGDRFLYWIDLACGIILSDVTAEIPEFRYVPLPADPLPLVVVTTDGDGSGVEGCHNPRATRNVCVTVDGAARFIRVSPRCCCGRLGASSCPRSQHAFTITTWTLRTDSMTWYEDCVLDCGELWEAAAEAVVGVPLVPPAFPIVSVEDPDVVCFMSSELLHPWGTLGEYTGDKTTWLVAVDMRRKTLRSVCRYPEENDEFLLFYLGRQPFLPCEVSSYFGSTSHDGEPVTSDNQVPASPEDEEEMMEVLTAIREIPGMAREEMLSAHSLVAGDDRRVRFLAALPVGMRKEYCMITTDLDRASKPQGGK